MSKPNLLCRCLLASAAIGGACLAHCVAQAPDSIPHFVKAGNRSELLVDGKPFLIFGGELMNSSSASAELMRPEWPRIAAYHMNTVLTPLSWELIEPEEGKFDFSTVDGLIQGARENHLHLVFLWLASWKNGMSSYAPMWVKQDTQRFPRAVSRAGKTLEVLSPTTGVATQAADARAFAALMHHIREFDGSAHTVLMMQVENEVGILGSARDFSPLANAAFAKPVPAALMSFLEEHKATLSEPVRRLWQTSNFRRSGTWTEVFGSGQYTDELFMTWNFAAYVEGVAAAGKKEYPIPMYVNAWEAQLDYPRPGTYPSGGPNFRMLDVWRAGGKSLDFFSPDDYAKEFESVLPAYEQPDNPLFIPETKPTEQVSANAFLAFGSGAFGFSPFGIDHWEDSYADLSHTYEVLGQVAPKLLEEHPGRIMKGFSLNAGRPSVLLQMDGIDLTITLDDNYYSHPKVGGGIVIMDDPTHLWAIGRGFMVAFTPSSSPGSIGIGAADRESCTNGVCKPVLRMNGDETYQGSLWRFPDNDISIQRISLYRY
jgi:beta-galactosidase GanA